MKKAHQTQTNEEIMNKIYRVYEETKDQRIIVFYKQCIFLIKWIKCNPQFWEFIFNDITIFLSKHDLKDMNLSDDSEKMAYAFYCICAKNKLDIFSQHNIKKMSEIISS
jgi:hypothetical protein